jgi:hypothetical protein
MEESNIKIAKSTIQECINKSIKFFYAYDDKNIFQTLEEAQIHRANNKLISKIELSLKTYKIWYFFFDKNLELGGFTMEN